MKLDFLVAQQEKKKEEKRLHMDFFVWKLDLDRSKRQSRTNSADPGKGLSHNLEAYSEVTKPK